MDALIEFFTTPLGIVIAVLAVVVVVGCISFLIVRSTRTPSTLDGESRIEAAAEPRITPIPEEETPLEEEPRAGPDETAHTQVEVPESLPSRSKRLRARLAGAGTLGRAILDVFARGDLKATDWEEIEESLLAADLGLEATDELMESLKRQVAIEGTSDPAKVRALLRSELLTLVGPDMDRALNLTRPVVQGHELPATVLMVGVNGTGKTTTVGKLARVMVAEGQTVLLGAADTFRAAAAEQLHTWGERVGVDVVRSDKEGADPASVAFDAVREGKERGVDVVLVDTAGRLQNKSTLMDELGKVKRVMEKQSPVNEVLLVLDATTGQNGLKQAEIFASVVGVTGIVLTKLDGSAKGGIVVSVQRALNVPVKFVGLGEGVDDLAPFDANDFVDAIVDVA